MGMATYCKDLLEIDVFKRIPLIAGEQGLDRRITWPYVATTHEIANWLHGGELLFVTGVGSDLNDEWLISLLMECISSELSGMVILTGGPYIKSIPSVMCELADEHAFPLFEMPWEIKLVDITQAIVNLIINHQDKYKKSRNLLERLLFTDPVESSSLDEVLKIYGFKNYQYKFIAVISVIEDELNENSREYIESNLISMLSGFAIEDKLDLITMSYAGKVVCLVLANTLEHIKTANKYLMSTVQMAQAKYSNVTIQIGFGRTYEKLNQVLKSFNEALKVLSFSRQLGKEEIINYSDLGIYRMFFGIKDTAEIKAYSEDNIGELIRHDQQNKTFLLVTLKEFLVNNGNLVKTAQALYIHRNTLLYRLNSIRNLIQKDLDNGMVRMELFNSIIIHEYLSKEN